MSRKSVNLDFIPGPFAQRTEPGICFFPTDGKADCKVHPWTLPSGPTFGCPNSFQTNLSGSPLRCVRNDDEEYSHSCSKQDVLRIRDVGFESCETLLAQRGLQLIRVEDSAPIPGSYWGEPEAGVIGCKVYARADTPLHSLLHEACHLLVAGPQRRAHIHTDASDSQIEEDATCYLQIVLADALPGFGRERALRDMDAWGYSFRLGSARAWFEGDAEGARAFLHERNLLPA